MRVHVVDVLHNSLASAFTESTFTCYKLLSRTQEPFLFVNPHAVICVHMQPAALSSRIAAGNVVSVISTRLAPRYTSQRRSCPISPAARQLIGGVNSAARSCPISAGRLVSWLP